MLLKKKKNQWVIKEVKKQITKHLETNNNENKPYKNLWDATKAVVRGKFLAIQAFLKKTRKISNQQPNLPPKRIRRTNKT